ncbi:MAG: UDP-N-acetyl-alpha-D-muramoyl-L-alanyl-L-glutamat e epimerase [Wenzhouxiangellaceae bacterium]
MNVKFDPAQVQCFEFVRRGFDPSSGRVELVWRLILPTSELEFTEVFLLPGPRAAIEGREEAIEAALDLLHWVAGVSYWKVACRGGLRFATRAPDVFQARVLTDLYRNGLAEMAWTNGLDAPWWPEFPGRGSSAAAHELGLGGRALVATGGGKDSLVALSRIQALGLPHLTVQVGSAARIAASVADASPEHRVIQRRLAPELAQLDGALNGHVPITAINAAVLILAALLWDCDAVVFANERSADAPQLVRADGLPVNHQYAKSFEFEASLAAWVKRSIAIDLDVFSLLRRDTELAICREFAALAPFHERFSSCNRNFHLDGPRTDRWCLNCPKCHFVYLCLAPFLDPERMIRIFGADLLADAARLPGFAELLEIDGHRPFECVGEAREAAAAVGLLAQHPAWRDHVCVRELAARLAGRAEVDAAPLFEPAGPHLIPERFLGDAHRRPG